MKILINEQQLNMIIEGHKDTPEIIKLSDDIVDLIFPKIKHYYIEAINSAQRYRKIKIVAKTTVFRLNELFDENYIINNYNRLSNFINSDIRIAFSTQLGNNYGGSFHKPENFIFINMNDFDFNNEIVRYLTNYNFKLNDQRLNNVLSKFKENLKHSLPHELTHAFDNFRSKGNFDNNTKAKLYLSKWDPINQKFNQYKGGINNLYLKLPHEIWGRFTDYIVRTDISNVSFNQLVNDFKKNFPGYDIIGEKTKIRLLKELYKYYMEQNKVD